MIGKFRINFNYFPNEESKMAYTYNPTKADAEQLSKCLKWQKDNPTRGIRFVRLDLSKLKLYAFVDASFANNKNFSSQIGYVLVLANETQISPEAISIKGNILHWSSTKCKRVTRSILAAELYAMVADFDMASVIQHTMQKLAGEKPIPVVICTDSFSLYDCLTKLGRGKATPATSLHEQRGGRICIG